MCGKKDTLTRNHKYFNDIVIYSTKGLPRQNQNAERAPFPSFGVATSFRELLKRLFPSFGVAAGFSPRLKAIKSAGFSLGVFSLNLLSPLFQHLLSPWDMLLYT